MSAIYQQPLVADLLISLATMAAGNPNQKHRQRFFACPYPPSDFVCQKTRSTNAANADDNMGIQWTELIKVTLLFNVPCIKPCCLFEVECLDATCSFQATTPSMHCATPKCCANYDMHCTSALDTEIACRNTFMQH